MGVRLIIQQMSWPNYLPDKHPLNTLSVSRLADYFKIGPVFNYFLRVFRKPDPSRPTNVNLRMMHGINRISIIMFLFCILVMLYRAFLR